MAAKFWAVLALCAILNVPVFTSGNSHLCTYFGGGRSPKEEYSLSNCTWYRENACCKRTEVTSVFSEMPALLTSDKGCYDRMNYLMCYFCSPEQSLWYNKTLSICHSYCEELFSYCESAKYNGHSISSQYKNGIKFCEALAFNVVAKGSEDKHHCFKFDEQLFGSGKRAGLCQSLFVTALIIISHFSWRF